MRNIASVCLEIGYPTLASIPHSIINGYKRVLAVAVETDYSFPLAEKVMEHTFQRYCCRAHWYTAEPVWWLTVFPRQTVKRCGHLSDVKLQ